MSVSAPDGALELSIEQATPMPLVGKLRCETSELTALVGPSGAGKTSILRVMAGLIRPRQGRLQIGSQVWLDTAAGIFLPPQQRRVGLVFQHYALMPHLNALDNVALPLGHLPREERRKTAAAWLERVQITGDLLSRRPGQLSGGQQQRVAVARALAREPSLVLLDEPFSAVDQMNRRTLYQLLAELRETLTVPMVLVTHDLHEARLLADRLIVMDRGTVLQQGAPHHVHRSPRNARVADLVGIHNRFQGVWDGPSTAGLGRLRWSVGAAPAASDPVLQVLDKGRIKVGQQVTWIIPGDGLTLVDGVSSTPSMLVVPTIIGEVRHLGETTLANLQAQTWPGIRIALSVAGSDQRRLIEGSRLHVGLDLTKVHVMPGHLSN